MQNFLKIIKKLSKPIYKILLQTPTGITEYDLIRKLEEIQCIEHGNWGNELELFQRHFIVFHTLYRIKSYLQTKKKKSLQINCMEIKILPWMEFDTNNLAEYDTMQNYYLEPNNLFETSEKDVQDMLGDFWKRFKMYNQKEEAFEILGAKQEMSLEDIKSRYRELIKENHPDRGGDGTKIGIFNEAMKAIEELYV